jgi:hypothetical protein
MGHVEGLGDFDDANTVDVMQDEEGTRAGSERKEHQVHEIVLYHLLGGIGGSPIGRIVLAVIVVDGPGDQAGDNAAMAQVLEGEVGCDAEEPAGGMIVVPEVGEVLPGTDEGFLAEIIGRLLLAGEAPEIAKDDLLIAAEECFEVSLRRRCGRTSGRRAAACDSSILRGECQEEPPPRSVHRPDGGRGMYPARDAVHDHGTCPLS